jgi:HEAT repeat protein
MPETTPPARPSRPLRRKRWIILAAILAVLACPAVMWHVHMKSPAGRAEALLEQVRQRETGNAGLVARLLKAVGLEEKDPVSDLGLASALADLGPEVAPVLAEALKDSSTKVRAFSAAAFGELAEPVGVEPLLEALASETDRDVRVTIIGALGNIADRRAVPALIHVLESSKDGQQREVAAEALGYIGGPEAREALETVLKDPSDSAQDSAVSALGNIGDPASVPALLAVLADKDRHGHYTICLALGDIGDARAVPALITCTISGDRFVRPMAVRALGKIGDPRGLDAILSAAGSNDMDVRRDGLMALGRMGDRKGLALLESGLQDVSSGVRACAAEGLGHLGGPEAAPLLVQMLKDPDMSVRIFAIRALGYLGDQQAIPSLIAAARQSHASRFMVIWTLGVVGGPGADDALVGLLKDPDVQVRQQAVFSCGLRGRAEALPLLEELTADRDTNAAFRAVAGLGAIKTPEARSALETAAAKAPSYLVRRFAAMILKDGLARAAVAQFRSRPLSTTDTASHILRSLGDASVLPALEEVRRTGDRHVREEAARVIEYLKRRAAAMARQDTAGVAQ